VNTSLALISRYDPALAETVGQGGDDELTVIARLAGPDHPGDEVRIITQFGDIATLRLARHRIAEFAAREAVLSLEASRNLRPFKVSEEVMPADATPSAGTTPVSLYTRRPPGIKGTGKGCVVGVLDWGCDFAFPSFRQADGTSRILALWDQRSNGSPADDNRWGYGRIHSNEAINQALTAEDPYQALDYHPADAGGSRGAHGTHVLDIAAGNGRGGGMPGVAPEAGIVFVHLSRTTPVLGQGNLGDSASVLEALDFVFSTAGDRPCVVNMSVGAHGGPHDGSTLVELGIDRAVSIKAGRAVVNSSGNYYAGAVHTQGAIGQSLEQVLHFRVPAGDDTSSELEVWYPAIDKVTATVVDPSGNRFARVAPGQSRTLSAGGRDLGRIYHNIRQTTNGDHQVDLFLEPHAPGGNWQLRLHGDEIKDGRFHAWIERDTGLRPRFLTDQAINTSTTGTLCNGLLSITVGAYDPHDGGRRLGRFSSSGPTRDGRVKPEIVAPGVRICAAMSAPPGELPGPRYANKSGTSMAAPHVTGAIALMFEAAGAALEISQTRALLFASADRADMDRLAPKTDLHRVGYGYLDIAAAERLAREWRAQIMNETDKQDRQWNDSLQAPLDEPGALEGMEVIYREAADRHEPWPDVPKTPGPNSPISVLSSNSAPIQHLGLLSPGPGGHEQLKTVARPSEVPAEAIEPGDLLVRSVPYEGIFHRAVIVSERPQPAAELALKGVAMESFRPGLYVEVLEIPMEGGPVRRVARRLTDYAGRMPREQTVYRPASNNGRGRQTAVDLADSAFVPGSAAESAAGGQYGETVSVDDVAAEMVGRRCRFTRMYTSRRGTDSRTFHDGAILYVGGWTAAAADAVVDGFTVPKIVIDPYNDRAAGVRRYDVPLAAQRSAVIRNARRLADWMARQSSYASNRSQWESEKTRLEGLLQRRELIYSRMWVRQMMYNRFDTDILHWTRHYNRLLTPGTPLDPNIPKSIFYQESRMGTSGAHLMPPPSDWSSSSRHPVRSRFNIGQAIDSFGPQQWLMMREMAPSLFRRHGLDALESQARWMGMTNEAYVRHATFMLAMRQFFEYRSGGNNLMGTAGRDLHEDYGFWIRTAIRWLFHKYQRLRPPTWPEAVRAYNGSGPAARRYRDAVMARVGSMAPYAAEQFEQDDSRPPVFEISGDQAAPHQAGEQLGMPDDRSLLFDVAETPMDSGLGEDAPRPDSSARLTWEDLTRVRDSRGGQQVFYLVTGAPPRLAAAGDEGKAVFHLRVENTNSVYNHQDVATRTRLIDYGPRRIPRVAMGWTRPQSGPELEDESSRVIVLRLNPETLAAAYNAESPLTRLEVEYHWREAGESRQRHYNQTGLDFMLVAPIEFMFSRSRRMHEHDYELNDAAYKDDFWIPITGVNFTPEIQSPITVQLDVSTSLSRQDTAGAGAGSRTSTSRTRTTTTSNTFSLQLSGEMSQGGSASASIEIFELGLERMFKLGASLGYSRTTTDTSSSTVAREFSRSLTWSRSYSTSQAVTTRTTLQISPPTLRAPSGTGGTGTTATARGGTVGVYLYPTIAFFEVPFVRFTPANALGQGTRRDTGTVAVPHITGWRLTTHVGA
jgi:subtilisin family serine protease